MFHYSRNINLTTNSLIRKIRVGKMDSVEVAIYIIQRILLRFPLLFLSFCFVFFFLQKLINQLFIYSRFTPIKHTTTKWISVKIVTSTNACFCNEMEKHHEFYLKKQTVKTITTATRTSVANKKTIFVINNETLRDRGKEPKHTART